MYETALVPVSRRTSMVIPRFSMISFPFLSSPLTFLRFTLLLGLVPVIATCGTEARSEVETTGPWRAVDGEATPDESRWKEGDSSLRWDFEPGGTLTHARDEALAAALDSRTGGVRMWLYSETPLEGRLEIRAGRYTFPVHLGFTGWRAVWVMFSEDADEGVDKIDGFRITGPAEGGTLWLDLVAFGDVPWFRMGDALTPYTNPRRSIGAGGDTWRTPECWHVWARENVPEPDRAPDAGERAAFEVIAARYEDYLFGRMDDPRQPVRLRAEGLERYIESGHRAFERLGLERRGDRVVAGPGAFATRDDGRTPLPAEVFQPVALPLALDARLNNSDRARQRFLDLIDYAHDQGWAERSMMGTNYLETLRISGWVHGIYILRDFLRQEDRLDREMATLAYHIEMAEIHADPEHPGANADYLRTKLKYRLLHTLLQDDTPEKPRDMRAFVRWADSALDRAPGYAGTIKPDDTVFHHGAPHPASYGSNAIHMAALVYYLLHDTEFALANQTGENLKDALLAVRFMTGKYHTPWGVNCRRPIRGPIMVATSAGIGYLAKARDDRELGRAFARLWNPDYEGYQNFFRAASAGIFWPHAPGSLPLLLDIAERYEPEPDPQGHRAHPYAGMNVHRRDRWVASVIGWGRYHQNYENGRGNKYGHYSTHGVLQIFGRGNPVTPEESGFVEAGFDWRRPPGATVIRTSLETLSQVPIRLYTDDPFLGGVELDRNHGLWAMRFEDPHLHHETGFRFRKSAVFVDGTIVRLGSGIANSDTQHPTETALFQNILTSPEQKEALEAFPLRETVDRRWLLDAAGNGYYVPEGRSIELFHGRQESRHASTGRETGGDAAVAWIDHGTAPENDGYEYAIRPGADADDMETYAAAPDYEVIRRDASAHIVRFPAAGVTAFTLFEETDDLQVGPIRSTDRPCLFMTRADGDRVRVAIADPDLRLSTEQETGTRAHFADPSEEAPLRIQLSPDWRLAAAPDNIREEAPGQLEIICRDGATYTFLLEPAP